MEKKDYLRLKAEELLHSGVPIGKTYYEKDLESLVEDLNVYQIELEHQNLSLQKSQEEELKLVGADNLKRIFRFNSENHPERILSFMEQKTVWHPIGI